MDEEYYLCKFIELKDEEYFRYSVYEEYFRNLPNAYHNEDFYLKLMDIDENIIIVISSFYKCFNNLTPKTFLFGLRKLQIHRRDLINKDKIFFNYFAKYGEDFMTYDILYEFCKCDGNDLYYVPIHERDEKICAASLESQSYGFYDLLPDRFKNENFLSKHNKRIENIPLHMRFRYSKALLKKIDCLYFTSYERYPFTFKLKKVFNKYFTSKSKKKIYCSYYKDRKIDYFFGIGIVIDKLLFMKN